MNEDLLELTVKQLRNKIEFSCPDGMLHDAEIAVEKLRSLFAKSHVSRDSERENLLIVVEFSEKITDPAVLIKALKDLWNELQYQYFAMHELIAHRDGIKLKFCTIGGKSRKGVAGEIVALHPDFNQLVPKLEERLREQILEFSVWDN